MTENQTSRIVSVDAFRGFVMFWLIGGQSFVTALAVWSGWPAFRDYVKREFTHPPWHGFYGMVQKRELAPQQAVLSRDPTHY